MKNNVVVQILWQHYVENPQQKAE